MSGFLQNVLESMKYKRDADARDKKINLDADKEQQRIDSELKKLDEHKRQFDLTQKATADLTALRIEQMKREIAKDMVMSGETLNPLNDTSQIDNQGNSIAAPGILAALENIKSAGAKDLSSMTPAAPGRELVRIPGVGGSVELPSREKLLGNMLEEGRIKQAPELERQTAIEQIKKDNELQSLIARNSLDMAKQERELQTRKEIAKNNVVNQLEVAKIRGKSILQAAQIRKNLAAQGENVDQELLQSSINGLWDGSISREDLTKSVGMKTAGAVINAFMKSGGVALSDKTKTALVNYPTMLKVLPVLTELNDLIEKHGVQVNNPFSEYGQKATRLKKMLEFNKPIIARFIEKESGRISNQQIKYSEQAIIPESRPFVTSVKENKALQKDLTKAIHGSLDDILKTLPPKQRVMVKSRILSEVESDPNTDVTPKNKLELNWNDPSLLDDPKQ